MTPRAFPISSQVQPDSWQTSTARTSSREAWVARLRTATISLVGAGRSGKGRIRGGSAASYAVSTSSHAVSVYEIRAWSAEV